MILSRSYHYLNEYSQFGNFLRFGICFVVFVSLIKITFEKDVNFRSNKNLATVQSEVPLFPSTVESWNNLSNTETNMGDSITKRSSSILHQDLRVLTECNLNACKKLMKKNRVKREQISTKTSKDILISIEFEGGERFENGITYVLEKSIVNIRLFGYFTNGIKLRIKNDEKADCSEEYYIDAPDDALIVVNKDSWVNETSQFMYGRIENIQLPSRKHFSQLYFCLSDTNGENYKVQPTSNYLKIFLSSKAIPLWAEIILICILIFLSGLFSGLNLGLLTLDKTDLKIIIATGTAKEKEYATKIAPVREHGSFLLCSLVLSNVFVNCIVTWRMDGIISGMVAVTASTVAIVIFGEIIPQALCSRYGLAVGAKTIYLTYFFMVVTSPLAWPLSKILDRILGEEIGNVYSRERLKELIKVTKDVGDLDEEELVFISGVLDMKNKCVADIMIKLEHVFMLPSDSILDYDTFAEIESQGYSRIPVYEKNRSHIIALLNIKQLTLLDPSDNIPIHTVVEYYQNSLFYVFENTKLDFMFRAFREGDKGHLAFVRKVNDDKKNDPSYETIGIVTMEDVLEALLQSEILDETDIGKYKEHREKKQHSGILTRKRTMPSISIPSPLILAACQYLTTAVPAFSRENISENILNRLIKTTVANVKPPKYQDGSSTSIYTYLYERGKSSNQFIMILEGKVEVEIGTESMKFQGGPFQCFGSEFLLSKPIERKSTMKDAKENKDSFPLDSAGIEKHFFVPDYSVRVLTETLYVGIRYSAYCSAKVATSFERKYIADPKAASSNENWRNEVETILKQIG